MDSKINRKPQTHKRPRKKRGAIPVLPPKIPSNAFGDSHAAPIAGNSMAALMYQKLKNEINNSIDKGKCFGENIFKYL